jgi:hypothetical protein
MTARGFTVAEKVVNCDDIERYGGRVEDQLLPYTTEAKSKLEPARLPEDAMGVWGEGTVKTHNDVLEHHKSNLDTGHRVLSNLANALKKTGRNWRESDQPFVEK